MLRVKGLPRAIQVDWHADDSGVSSVRSASLALQNDNRMHGICKHTEVDIVEDTYVARL